MTEFVEGIMPAVMQLAIAVVTCIFGYAGLKIKELYKQKVSSAEIDNVVWHTVQYVEQICRDLHGQEKFEFCLDEVSKVLEEKGVPVGKEELKVLIESAVKSMNTALKG